MEAPMLRNAIRNLCILAAFSLPFTPSDAFAERPSQIDATRTDPIQFSYRFTRGQSTSYELTGRTTIEKLSNASGDRIEFSVTVPVRHEVQNVNSDGVATISTSFGVPTLDLQNAPREHTTADVASALRAARVTRTIASDGRVSDTAGDLTSETHLAHYVEFLADALTLQWMSVPVESISVGDSWLQTVPKSIIGNDDNLMSSISVRYTVAGFANVGGREHAVIDAEYTARIDGTTTFGTERSRAAQVVLRGSGEGYVLFDTRSGRITESAHRIGSILTITEANAARESQAITVESSMRVVGTGSSAQEE